MIQHISQLVSQSTNLGLPTVMLPVGKAVQDECYFELCETSLSGDFIAFHSKLEMIRFCSAFKLLGVRVLICKSIHMV